MNDYYNPWEGQGQPYFPEGMTTPAEGGSSIWDWYRKNGDVATDMLQDGWCLVAPNSARCRQQQTPKDRDTTGSKGNNTVLYILLGVVVLLLLVLILQQ